MISFDRPTNRRYVDGVAWAKWLACFALALLFSLGAAAAARAETRTLKLYFIHTKERAEITFKRNGRYDQAGLKKINRFLRDWRRNEPTRMDPRLLEAAKDLYASSTQAFLRVTLPLSAPGIVAGTLLTFIPAAGDFINAALLGTPQQSMIGNVIQAKFLESLDYPSAAALSFLLMGAILVGLLVYAKIVGSERLTG